MKSFLPLLLLACLLAGCAKSKPAEGDQFRTEPAKKVSKVSKKSTKKESPNETGPVLTPSTEKFGQVAMVNSSARFVVLSFPIGEVAAPGQRLNVYRSGLKIAELRVTGPQRENNTVADIVAGEPGVNDEVREN